MAEYQLTPGACDDLWQIEDFTLERFGLRQALEINQVFEQAFQRLAEQPALGHPREDLTPLGRSFLYYPIKGSFLIVYQPTDRGIQIVRVLGGGQVMQS